MTWPSVRMGDLLSLEYGKPLPRATRIGTGSVPVAGSNGVDGFHDAELVPGPGIVVGRKGSAGKVTWFEAGFWPIDTTYFVAHDDRATDRRWLYYLLQNAHLERLNKTTGVPGLNRNDAYAERALLPPPSEQRRIVKILDQADALRKLRREADAKAARILPALFLKMFGDPATNPMGWPVKRLGDDDVCEVNPRATRGLSDDLDASFVPMADIDERLGRIVGNQVRAVREVKKGFTPFQNADVLFAKITPCMQNGKAAIAEGLANDVGYGSTEFHVLRPAPGVAAEWVFALVRLETFRAQAKSAFTGSAGQQRVPANFLKQFRVPVPDPTAMTTFAQAARTAMQLCGTAEPASAKLDTLFSNLLQRAFSGQLTAKWRQARMQELLAEMRDQARLLNLPLPN